MIHGPFLFFVGFRVRVRVRIRVRARVIGVALIWRADLAIALLT